MTGSSMPLLRRAAAWAKAHLCTLPVRFSMIVAIVVAVASSAHAATPFAVRVTGTGPDVLLIPGLASSGAVWDETVKSLCGTHRCHVFTPAGFAGVPAQPGPLLDDVNAALATYIESQHLKAPTVVGHSLGGFVALKLAIDHPADVGRLVIVDALPALVMGSWIAYKEQSTLEQTRAIYARQYTTLAGVQIAMSPAGRHFIMLDDPAWFDRTLASFVP